MSKYHDDSTRASHAVPAELSQTAYSRFKNELGFFKRMLSSVSLPASLLAEHMQFGDSRAAVVVQAKTDVFVAAYSDELDGVAMLKFPEWVKERYPVKRGTRLLTVNTYFWLSEGVAEDLTPGPGFLKQYGNFFPVIAEFVVDNLEVIEARKRQIDKSEWKRTAELATQYIKNRRGVFRNGSPFYSAKSAKG